MNLLCLSECKVFLNIQNNFEQLHLHHLFRESIKNNINFFLIIKFKFLNLGSKVETLYFFFLSAFIQALPLSRLISLSPELPPKTTKTF